MQHHSQALPEPRVRAEASPNLIRPEVATRLRCGLRTVQELTRRRQIPHVVRPNSKIVLYPLDWIVVWEREPDIGLDVTEFEGGGRVVRPVAAGRVAVPHVRCVNDDGSVAAEPLVLMPTDEAREHDTG